MIALKVGMRLDRPESVREVAVHEHRGDQCPERAEAVVSPGALGIDEVDLPPLRLERNADAREMFPEAAGGGRRWPPSRPAWCTPSVSYMKLNFTT
jgi:hypothetical protein